MLEDMEIKFFAKDVIGGQMPTAVGQSVTVENFFGGQAQMQVTSLHGTMFMAKLAPEG